MSTTRPSARCRISIRHRDSARAVVAGDADIAAIDVVTYAALEALQNGHEDVLSAHCVGQNDKAIGMENEGNYMQVAPSAEHYATLVDLFPVVGDARITPRFRTPLEKELMAL